MANTPEIPEAKDPLEHRVADAWVNAHAPAKAIAQWTRAELGTVATLLIAWALKPSGTLSYK
jgi:predicted flavoprotein YhiN